MSCHNQKDKEARRVFATFKPRCNIHVCRLMHNSRVLAPLTAKFSQYKPCAFVFHLYFVSQGATLYHTLLICVHRLSLDETKSKCYQGKFQCNTRSEISLIWIGCLDAFSIPFWSLVKSVASLKPALCLPYSGKTMLWLRVYGAYCLFFHTVLRTFCICNL